MFCILKGDMSIIGPRPVVLTETELIEERKKTGAYAARPGLTGLAQVRMRDRLTDMKLKAEIDGEYVSKITFGQDFKIFWKTVIKVLKGDDVVEGDKVTQEETLVECEQVKEEKLAEPVCDVENVIEKQSEQIA